MAGGTVMGREAQSGKPSPLRTREVHGEPYQIKGRTLVPVARIVSYGQAKGLIGKDRVSGRAAGFVSTSPLAVELETADGKRRVAIKDSTTATLGGMILAGAVMTVLLAAIRRLGRQRLKGSNE
jgi:hypothetical protein